MARGGGARDALQSWQGCAERAAVVLFDKMAIILCARRGDGWRFDKMVKKASFARGEKEEAAMEVEMNKRLVDGCAAELVIADEAV